MPSELNDTLLVDDNSTLLMVLSEIFKEHGYVVRTASDGFEALAMIRDRVPDILISDLYMPRMSGFELLSVVRRRFPTVAVIAMSGAYSAATVSPGIAADGFYAKAQPASSCYWISSGRSATKNCVGPGALRRRSGYPACQSIGTILRRWVSPAQNA